MGSRNIWVTFLLFALCLLIHAKVVHASPFAYIPSSSTNTVTVIDIANDKIAGAIFVGHPQRGVAVSLDGTRVFVTMSDPGVNGSLAVIDTTQPNCVSKVTSSTIPPCVSTVGVGIEPIAVAVNPTGTRAYVGNNGHGAGNTVSVIDTTTSPPSVIGTPIIVGHSPGGMAINPAGTRLYVVNNPESSLSVIDITQEHAPVIANVQLNGSNALCGIAIDPTGTLAYIAGSDSQLIHVIDLTNNELKAEIQVVGRPEGVALHPSGMRLYVTQVFGANTVSVIDTTTNSVLGNPIPVNNPAGVEVNPAGTRVYVGNGASGTVSVINAACFAVDNICSNPLIDSVTVGGGPEAFGQFIGPQKPLVSFPLKGTRGSEDIGLGPYTAPLISVFDHMMEQPYHCDGSIEAFSIESASGVPSSSAGCLSSYPGLTAFGITGHYAGTAHDGPSVLNYDGHPGFDYKAELDTNVYAAAAGTISYPGFVFGLCPAMSPPPKPKVVPCSRYHVMQLVPDNAQELRLYYLHLDTYKNTPPTQHTDTSPGCPSVVTLPLAEGTKVRAGCLIALSGAAGAPNGPHLHFEVQRVLPVGTKPVDHYGWYGQLCNLDPYFARPLNIPFVTNVALWNFQPYLSTTAVCFGNVQVGHSGVAQVTLTNVARTTLNIAARSIIPADFMEADNCGNTLSPGGTCVITVTFTPQGVGNGLGTLTISGTDGGSPSAVMLVMKLTGKGN
jgi:YVTN family beta-propeller protein